MANKQKASSSRLDRDSGFSDASSGYLSAVDQTEFEDMGSSTASAQSTQSAAQVSQVPGAYQGVSPMIIMNNIVLKQSDSVMTATKPWGFNPSMEVIPQSPVVLLQPVVPSGNRTSQKYTKKRQSRNYLPILNSFLKIAPYPVHGSTDVGPGTFHRRSSGHSHGGKNQRHRHNDKRSRCLSLKQNIFETATADSNSVDPHSCSHRVGDMDLDNSLTKFPSFLEPSAVAARFSVRAESNPPALPEESPKATFVSSDDAENFPVALSPSSSKQKRFCNTYNVLSRSGLLGITLRTKELIRQNKRSQTQLQNLQAHTHLFLEAISSGDPQVWARLQLTLQDPVSEDPKDDALESALF